MGMLGAFEGCYTQASDSIQSSDIKALGRIAMEVMQGEPIQDVDVIGMRDLSSWDSDVAGFLAETTSATSAEELKKVSEASGTATSC